MGNNKQRSPSDKYSTGITANQRNDQRNNQCKQNNGKLAEYIAYKYLLKYDLKFICKNYYCRYGEIDLIMLDRDKTRPCLVFIEVKYRKTSSHGHPIEAINTKKQQKLLKSADYFLLTHQQFKNIQYRFDAITILGNINDLNIDWFRNIINN